jgi:hypothetical protein
MACDISWGRVLPCTDAVGGLDAIYFINEDTLGVVTFGSGDSEDVITSIVNADGTTNLYKYDLKGTSTFNQVMNSSRENGTTFVEQTLVLNLPVMSSTFHKQFKLLAWANPKVIVSTTSGSFFLMGLEFGCDVTTINANSGAAMGDMTGYEVTLVAREKTFANYLNATTQSGMVTLVDGNLITAD